MPPHLLQVLQLIIFLCYSLWEETFVKNVLLSYRLCFTHDLDDYCLCVLCSHKELFQEIRGLRH